MFFKRKNVSLIIVCLFVFSLTACSTSKYSTTTGKPITKSNFLLGTIIEISLYDKQDEAIIDKAFDRIKQIEAKMTINNAETSEIIALNKASGISEVKLSSDTFEVLERGKYYSELTDGRFDITVGSIVKLWNIGTDYAAVPAPDILDQKED